MNIKQLNEELDNLLQVFREVNGENIIISKRKLKKNKYTYTLYDIDKDKILEGVTVSDINNPDNYAKNYFKEKGFDVDDLKIKNEIATEIQKELEKRGYTDKNRYRVTKKEKDGDVFVDIDKLKPTYLSQIDQFIIYGINGQGNLSKIYK
jgi:hypothetical protein